MKSVTVEQVLSDEEVDARLGTFVSENDVQLLVSTLDEPTEVLKPDGSVLLRYFPGALTPQSLGAAYPVLARAAGEQNNRGFAAGVIPIYNKVRFQRHLKNGKKSSSNIGRKVNSTLIGYFDRYPRTPYCRKTAFNQHQADQFRFVWPLLKEISECFRVGHPERYAFQKAAVEDTSRDFFIPDTVFTTITVNRDMRTALHFDAGDYADGFGVMTALRRGYWTGRYTAFPKYGCAVDLQNGGVVLADVHEAHGNTDGHTVPSSDHERIALVCYYRERMMDCGTAEEELARAQNRQQGDTLRG